MAKTKLKTIPPLPLRKLAAEMKIKHLSLETVATKSGVHYATASGILNGKLNCRERLARIAAFIHSAPMPVEA